MATKYIHNVYVHTIDSCKYNRLDYVRVNGLCLHPQLTVSPRFQLYDDPFTEGAEVLSYRIRERDSPALDDLNGY